jgi:hypothetical protein
MREHAGRDVEVEVLDGLAECADRLLGRNGAEGRRGMERERDGVYKAGGAETRGVSFDRLTVRGDSA